MNNSRKFNYKIYEVLKEAKLQGVESLYVTFFEKNLFIKTKEYSFLPLKFDTIGYSFKKNIDEELEKLRIENETFGLEGKSLTLTTITAASYFIDLTSISIEDLKTDLLEFNLNVSDIEYFILVASEIRDIHYIFELLDAFEKIEVR